MDEHLVMIAAGREPSVAAPHPVGDSAGAWYVRMHGPHGWGMSVSGTESASGASTPGGGRTNVAGNTHRTVPQVSRGNPGTRAGDGHPTRARVPDHPSGRRGHRHARDCRSLRGTGLRHGTDRVLCGGGGGLAASRQGPPADPPGRQLLAARAGAPVGAPRASFPGRARASTRITEATR